MERSHSFFTDENTKPKSQLGIVINEYLSSYSTNRNVDNVFKEWMRHKDSSNPKKLKEEWDALYQIFLNE